MKFWFVHFRGKRESVFHSAMREKSIRHDSLERFRH